MACEGNARFDTLVSSMMAVLRPLAVLALSASLAFAAQADQQFTQTVKPFLSANCVSCHTGANAAAQLDLRQYHTVADVVKDHGRWALVAEKLKSGEMPPKAMQQPPAEEKQRIIEWVETMRSTEARKNAGDPGIVLARRLSNAEYNNSIRDLTGVDLKPTREFPVDPSNTEGFDNSGESLMMSPALLNKYLQAAREVASHLVLKPVGLDFAPHLVLAESDREKYTILRIVDFYERQPTDFAAYFEAAWNYKHRAALGKPDASLADFARAVKISPKYLPLVWGILEETKEDVGPVARLQTMWRMLPGPQFKQAELVKEGCAKMRNYVLKVRGLTMAQHRSPKVTGLSGTSQPLMNWKLRAYAAGRRKSDATALQVEGEPPMQMPAMQRGGGVPTEDQVGQRNAALVARARAGDPDLLVPAGQRGRYEASFAKFAEVFPDAFYIKERGRFYPDDSEDKGRLLSAGFHNVMGYFRDDTPLQELILDEKGRQELEMLWLEFDTVGDYTTRTYTQFYFNQSGEIDGRGRESGSFRPGDAAITTEKVIFGVREQYLEKAKSSDATAKAAIQEHFALVNARIREVEKARIDAEPTHLEAMEKLAERAYRRPLTAIDKQGLRDYYRLLRDKSGLNHEDAIRDMVVLVLMSPDFFYRIDLAEPPPVKATLTQTKPRSAERGKRPQIAPASTEKVRPLPTYALASKLSYFIWASMPDQELMAADLAKPDVLAAQVKRMLKDPRSYALATEFAGNWLGFRRFEDIASVDRTRFPDFTNELRKAMYEEPVRFVDDLIRNDRSMLEALYGKHTFVNRVLAEHYGIQNFRIRGNDWVKIEDARRYGRGGLLPMAAFLTKNSPGLRTSPVKRGYWVAKTLLGEAIPPPPNNVPELPGDEQKTDKPLRQLLAQHRANASCAGCHNRFDGLGLAFEGYGPIGQQRANDLAGRPVETTAEFPGGQTGNGLEGLTEYIKAHREKDFVNTLGRKLLVYALGRSLQLSDEPLLDEMKTEFAASGYRFSALIESIVKRPQFTTQRNPQYRSENTTQPQQIATR